MDVTEGSLGETRNEFFRRAVETRLKQEKESSAIRDYVSGYQQYPESDEEVQAAHRIGSAVLSAEPWQ
jgi:hypothetical protein